MPAWLTNHNWQCECMCANDGLLISSLIIVSPDVGVSKLSDV